MEVSGPGKASKGAKTPGKRVPRFSFEGKGLTITIKLLKYYWQIIKWNLIISLPRGQEIKKDL
jgi:hypothetical protein